MGGYVCDVYVAYAVCKKFSMPKNFMQLEFIAFSFVVINLLADVAREDDDG